MADSDPFLASPGPILDSARLAAIVESSDDAIVSKTLDGTILSWNWAAERIFGYSAKEMIGHRIYRIIPPDLHPEENEILARIAQGEHIGHFETTRIRKDGSLVPISVTISPVRDLSGRIVGASSIKRDVSEQRRSAELVSRAVAIIQSSDDAIISKTLHGRVVSWNPAAERIFQYSAEEMIGASILKVIPPHLHSEEEQILSRIARGDHVEHYETTRVRKDGQEISIALTISPVRDASGQIIGAASIKRDVTAQKLAEIAMRQTSKMEAIGRLAGGLAHDFNNQLHALSGFVHFIDRDRNLSPTSRQDLLQIQKAADRMASLTRQLLAFARQQVLTPEILELDALVLDTEPMLQRLIGSSVEIRLLPSPGPKWVRADRAQLVQVLLNLSINARDAMPSGGLLTIETETLELAPRQMVDRTGTPVEPGAYARLAVTDTGKGIDPQHLPRVFEPFYTTKGVGLGTGLGLATVEGIVSQSGGYLQLQSTPNEGTLITVFLPLSPAPSLSPSPPSTPRSPERIKGRLLVVDDDPHVRAVITRLLRSEGYDVTEAGNGKQGLECLEQAGGGIDLVITDLVMPVMGGREFVQELQRRYPAIDAIWISGHPREAEFTDSTLELHRPFLQKPIAADLLIETVEELLRARQTRASGSRQSV